MEGVHNLHGRLMALDQIAEELGIELPRQVAPEAGRFTSSTSSDAAASQSATQATAATGCSSSKGQSAAEEETYGMRVTPWQEAGTGASAAVTNAGFGGRSEYAKQALVSCGPTASSSSSSAGLAGGRGMGFSKQQQWQISIQGLIEKSDQKASTLAGQVDKLAAEVSVSNDNLQYLLY